MPSADVMPPAAAAAHASPPLDGPGQAPEPAQQTSPPPPALDPPAPPVEPGVFALVQALLADLPGLVSDRVQLFTLELGRATQALGQIVGLVLASAVLVFTAWLGLWACLAYAAVDAGLHWAWVMLVLIACNAGLAVGALLRARTLARLLTLPATVRRLTGPSPLAGAFAESKAKEARDEH